MKQTNSANFILFLEFFLGYYSWQKSSRYIKKKVFILGITMQLDISAMLTPQVTIIICHHVKKNIIKKEKKKENIKIWGD